VVERLQKVLTSLWQLGWLPLPKDASEEEIKKALGLAVQLAKWVAAKTESTVDDEWVAKVETVLADEELFHAFYLVVAWTIKQFGAGDKPIVYSATPETAAAEAKLAFDPQWVVLAKILAELLIRFFFGEDK